MSGTDDPDFASLAEVSIRIAGEYAADDAIWNGSPFAWIRSLSITHNSPCPKRSASRRLDPPAASNLSTT